MQASIEIGWLWLCRYRWLLWGGWALSLCAALSASLFPWQQGSWMLGLCIVALLSNWLLVRYRNQDRTLYPWLLATMLLMDTAGLWVLLAFTGAAANPFTILFIVQIMLSAVLLSRRWTWLMTATSSVAFAFAISSARRLDAPSRHASS
ncbi:MAG: hypothetical protein IPJ88_17690 [Myxococcales bacterium]|nr:MAG: hypothetical protein IPJ88_17690 [Myxococcales bacterium]